MLVGLYVGYDFHPEEKSADDIGSRGVLRTSIASRAIASKAFYTTRKITWIIFVYTLTWASFRSSTMCNGTGRQSFSAITNRFASPSEKSHKITSRKRRVEVFYLT